MSVIAANNTNVPSSLKGGDPLHQKLLNILKSNNIEDEVDQIIVHNPEELKGERFVGEILYVKITFKDASLKELNLFAKKTSNEKLREAAIKESAFYNQFLPKARDFCRNNYKGSEKLLKCFPKCLHGDADLVVLDNLVLNDGWILLDKLERQDLFTAKMALKNVAGFHAASYVFIEEECGGLDKAEKEVMPEVCQELLFKDGYSIMVEKMIESSIKNCISLLETYASTLGSTPSGLKIDIADVQDAIKTLQALPSPTKLCSHMSSFIKRKPEDKFVVLNHGDFHNNNMFFKGDKDGKKVTDNIFFDMQLMRLCSPNVDIAWFLYISVKGHVRRAHHHELFQHYYDSLQESLALLGGRKCPWSFSELLDDYRICSARGFFIGLQIEIILNALVEWDASKASGGKENFMDQLVEHINKWAKNNPQKAMECVVEIVEIVKEYKKLGGFDVLLNL